jgi:glutathione S-transferase-like protein
MVTLYSYPELFGVADNNGYGLKVYAFLKLAGVPFVHEHIFDASAAPRGQLPYVVDDGETIGDSETIIAHLVSKYGLTIDANLTPAQRMTNLLVTRMLDDLYWVMSYSRWKDERFFPAFRDSFMAQHSRIDEAGMNKAREYNAQRYYFQGIGRYAPDQAYARGLADLRGIGRSDSRGRLCAWREADQHRCRHLRLHRQHSLLPDPDAPESFRHGPSQPRAPLRGDT